MKTKLIIYLSILCSALTAQKAISIGEAIDLALGNNYNIRIAHNQAEVAQINNTLGNAGMLPKIALNAGANLAENNVHQKSGTGTVSNYPNQSSTVLNAAAELSWTVFDGGKMFVTKNKLNELERLGDIQFRAQIIETVYNITAAYFEVVKEKQQLKSINEAINYNKERVKIAETGFNAGSLMKTDLLQAKIDLNVSMENAINQQYAIAAAKKSLNNLLGQAAETPIEVSDSISNAYNPNKAELLQKINNSNSSILLYQKQKEIAALSLKENQRAYAPTLNLKGGYYLSNTNNSEGSTLTNKVYGPQIGGTLSIPLYQAGETKRKIANARIEMQTADYSLENVKLQVNTELQNTLTDFENQQQLLQIETENKALAKENFEISLYRLKLGQTTSLEVHQAQENYVQSCTRLTNFQYNLKMAETKLKALVGGL